MRVDAGTVLGNRYQLTVPIASGGMGEVWEAHDELLGRTVAVKVLRSELATDPGFLARFRTEARNSARLAHPSIAATYDYGESNGSAWLVMELVPGEPLSDVLAIQHSVEPRRAMQIISSAAAGLAAAHAAGIVHRDVKPGNLLVMPNGGVKVTDFGIARAAAEAPLTATGQVMGTAAYLSPEQATGRRDLTPAVDVYALGVVAHEMLAGQRPFTGESQVAIALAQVNDPPPPLPASVPAGARALVDACLAKDPHARPRDAGVVAQVAALVADGDDVRAQHVLRAGLGSAAAGAAGTVSLPPTHDAGATQAMSGSYGDETVPWPEPPAPTTRRGAAGAAYGAAGAAYGAHGTHGAQNAHHDDPYGGYEGYDGYDDEPQPTGQRPGGRSRMTVPLLGLLAVLVVVLAALAFAIANGGSEETPGDSPSVSTPGASVTQTSSAPTASEPTETETSAAPTETTPSETATETATETAEPSVTETLPEEPTASVPQPSATVPTLTPTTAAAGATG